MRCWCGAQYTVEACHSVASGMGVNRWDKVTGTNFPVEVVAPLQSRETPSPPARRLVESCIGTDGLHEAGHT